MITLLFNWSVMLSLCFVTGYSVLHGFEVYSAKQQRISGPADCPYVIKSLDACLMAGFLAFTVYAQIYSLFGGVSGAAFLLMVSVNALLALRFRKPMTAFLRQRFRAAGSGRKTVLLLLFVLFLYGASRGYLHFDTGLYHAQAIRWIEEYGLVPGLGNLHSRFAYNSAAFPLTALFSMKWLLGQSLHGVAGCMAFVLAAVCTDIRPPFAARRKKKEKAAKPGEDNGGCRPVRVSDFARLAAVFYLTVLFREMVSPASDYYTMVVLFYLFIRWLDALERKEKSLIPYCLLCVLGVYAATLKLSAAVVCLLVIQPAARLIKEKRWKEIALFIGLGLLVCLPYLIRNVLISGWLCYPFTFFDWFPVDWKIAKGYADSDAIEIQVYAKLLYDVLLADTPLSGWVPAWFLGLKGLEKLWVLAGAVSFPAAAFYGIFCLVCGGRAWGKKARGRGLDADGKEPISGEAWLLEITLLVCWCFWFFGAPLVRYGYAYVLLLPFVTFGYGYVRLAGRTGMGQRFFSLLLLVILAYKGYNLTEGILETADQPYYIKQMDYGAYEAVTYEVDGVTVYVPVYSGQIGYDKFPSSPYVQDIELRGDELKGGFRKRGSAE